MSVNRTLNYLKSEQSIVILPFGDAVATSDKYLKGAGGLAGDGYPMPYPGHILAIKIYDGTSVHTDTSEVKFSAGDRISVYAVYDVTSFTVYVRKNGINTAIYTGSVGGNTDLFVTVTIKVTESL